MNLTKLLKQIIKKEHKIMAEYIEREELINQIRLMVNRSSVGETSLNDVSAKTICGLILEAPTADVVEVKHGEWKPKHYEGGFMDGTNFEECSICRYRRYFDDIRFKLTFDYCPKCGAKMDLKEGVEE